MSVYGIRPRRGAVLATATQVVEAPSQGYKGSMRSPRTIPGVILTLTLAACSLQGVPPTPASSSPPTPTPFAPRACPVYPGSPSPPDLAARPDPGTSLLDYFNAGGSPDRLEPSVAPDGLLPADVNGDGWLDWLVLTLDPASENSPTGGTLWLLTCYGSAYSLAFRLTPSDRGAPALHGIVDLTGDGAADVVVGLPNCGAHTCFEQAQILVWDGATLTNRLEGSSDDLPYPHYLVIPPLAGEPGRVEIRGTGFGSVGAGPYRPVARTWSWEEDAQRFVVTGEATLPTYFRIHVLHDADRAYLEGNYPLAQELYHRVITDDTLDDWEAGERGRQNLAAYANFRKVLTYLRVGDLGDAQVALGILQNRFPSGSTGHAYAEMAHAFWQEYGAGSDLVAACLAAQAFAEAHPAEILDPLYYGYANPAYTPQGICPVLR